MTLRCKECGGYDIEITAQSYNEESAFEAFKCQSCGGKGTLTHHGTSGRTELTGCLERDSR